MSIRRLSKTFGGVHALHDVDLAVSRGEVHGLLGHNGSGKSTLIKVLSGFHSPDAGARLEVNGTPVASPLKPGEFRNLGFGFVHQDLGLMPSLSVLENLRIAELTDLHRVHISWADERRVASLIMQRYDLNLDPMAEVRALPPWDQASVAIARAMEEIRRGRAGSIEGSLLVLDESTAFLPRERKERLYAIMRQVANSGASVLFVSHELDEVLSVTDTITVLRDGRVAGTVKTQSTTPQQLVELVVCCFGGPNLDELYVTTARMTDEGPLSPAQLRREPAADGLFRLRPGVRGLPSYAYGG